MLKIALPNGSLEEGTLRLFEEANLPVKRPARRHEARIDDKRVSLVTLMRPQHIPHLVEQGTYDLGVCGFDSVMESDARVSIVAHFCYSRQTSGNVQVVLIGAAGDATQTAAHVPVGSSILSEYPGWTRRFFGKLKISVQVEFSHGGTEAHIPRDYRYGVCITETGASIKANGLRVVQKLFDSNPVLIINDKAESDKKKSEAIHVLKLLLVGAHDARDRVYLVMNVPSHKKNAVLKRVPALKTPTISKLADGRSLSISSVVHREGLNEVIPDLLKHGAQDLLELPISKMIRSW